MKTAIIIPSKYEFNLISKNSFEGFDHMRISGMGKVNALIAAAELIFINGVQRIILFGLAGGIKNLKLGEVIEPHTFIEGDYVDPIHNEMNCLTLSPSKLLNYSEECTMVSQDRFLYNNPYKFTHTPLATDMESYALAKICNETMTEFHCVRIISDIVGDNVEDFSKLVKPYKLAMELVMSEISEVLCESK